MQMLSKLPPRWVLNVESKLTLNIFGNPGCAKISML